MSFPVLLRKIVLSTYDIDVWSNGSLLSGYLDAANDWQTG